MILTNSPHYKTIPWENPSGGSTPTKYILKLYIWDGLKSEVPDTANYELENINPIGLVGSVDVNISPYINDVLKVNLTKGCNTTVLNGECAVWTKTEVIYYQDGNAQSAEFTTIDLAVKGYGYGIEGRNPTTPVNNILAFGTYVNVGRYSQFTLPFKISEADKTAISVLSYPNNTLNFSETLAASSTSSELIKKVFVAVAQSGSETRIEIKKNNVLVHILNIVDELRHAPYDVYFINKYGALYSLTFFKEVVNTLKVSSEKYESSNGQAKDGVHQLAVYNKTANKEFKAKTGFISEENNEIIEQLMLSDSVWVLDGDTFNPVNITSSSLEEQTRQKDRLLNYEISFEYAYNHINNQ